MNKKLAASLIALCLAGEAHAQLNLSTRGNVGIQDKVLIAGFIVEPGYYTMLIVRAIGPGLASHNVTNYLEDPELRLYNADGNLLAIQSSYLENTAEGLALLSAKGLIPGDARECVLIIPIATATQYTAVVDGHWGTQGIALVEGYYFK